VVPCRLAIQLWNNAGQDGAAADDLEALAGFDVEFTPLTTPRVDVLDVLPAVQSWTDGAASYGWAILPTGPDSWTGDSSDTPSVPNRPSLTVSYVTGVTLPVGINMQPQGQTNLMVGANVQFSVISTERRRNTSGSRMEPDCWRDEFDIGLSVSPVERQRLLLRGRQQFARFQSRAATEC
jgi:hypothetical protein